MSRIDRLAHTAKARATAAVDKATASARTLASEALEHHQQTIAAVVGELAAAARHARDEVSRHGRTAAGAVAETVARPGSRERPLELVGVGRHDSRRGRLAFGAVALLIGLALGSLIRFSERDVSLR
jgi:hypothetical protein